jgi:hypothetical protein
MQPCSKEQFAVFKQWPPLSSSLYAVPDQLLCVKQLSCVFSAYLWLYTSVLAARQLRSVLVLLQAEHQEGKAAASRRASRGVVNCLHTKRLMQQNCLSGAADMMNAQPSSACTSAKFLDLSVRCVPAAFPGSRVAPLHTCACLPVVTLAACTAALKLLRTAAQQLPRHTKLLQMHATRKSGIQSRNLGG